MITDRIPDSLYHKLRHALVFLMNLPFYPVFLIWQLLRELTENVKQCFINDGSHVITRFWEWDWKDGDDD